MNYALDTVEVRRTKTGDKEYKFCTLKTENETFERVSIWPDYAGYAAVVEGGVVSGEVFKKGEFWNFKGENQKPAYTGGKTGAMSKVMETKNSNILAAQDRKHDAIKLAGAQRDAVIMVSTFEANTPFPTDVELKAKIEAWMKYFLDLGNQPFI
jgi:hypothetical protein